MRRLILATIIFITLIAIVGATALRAQEPVDVVLGEAVGQPGDTVSINIDIDAKAQVLHGFDIRLAFDGIALPDAVGFIGPDLPPEWTAVTNLAGSGDLRYVALDFTGVGAPLLGTILRAEFTIPVTAATSRVPISTSLVTISGADAVPFPINITDGRVIVSGCGDVTPDGVVDVGDAITLLQILVGLVEPTALQVVLGDVTGDGVLDIGDGILIIQNVVGLAPLVSCGP